MLGIAESLSYLTLALGAVVLTLQVGNCALPLQECWTMYYEGCTAQSVPSAVFLQFGYLRM